MSLQYGWSGTCSRGYDGQTFPAWVQGIDLTVENDGVEECDHFFCTMQQNNAGWWGEGEIKMFIDGDEQFPTICGTGTEDYFGGAWGFGRQDYSAPFNHVINYVPARDEQEFESFSKADKAFSNTWLDFTDENVEYMKRVRPIMGQPMVGRCDGTSAIIEDEGHIFLFNPNYRVMKAEFTLDASIGLTKGDAFTLQKLYPEKGRYIASPGG